VEDHPVGGPCSAKPGSAEDYPFGDEVAVFRVVGKMFALVTLGPGPCSVSLKCDPDLAAGLRRRYAAITADTTSTSGTGTQSH
jgi:predicted DNA-binding protein (MmcQ/YjbR family)